MRIGMLIAVEIKAFMEQYKQKYSKQTLYNFDIYTVSEDKTEIIAIHSKAGQSFAAAATMLLINQFKVDIIINYGIVGALKEHIKTMQTCLVKQVVNYDFDTSEVDNIEVGRHLEYDSIYIQTNKNLIDLALKIKPDLPQLTIASGNKFISSPTEKQLIGEKFNADICDMEAAGIILIADRANIPCLMIKTISDSLMGTADEFRKSFQDSSNLCMQITKEIIKNLENDLPL